MATPASHIDPMTGMFEALAERVAEKMMQRIQPLVEDLQPGLDKFENDLGIDPTRLYTQQEVADILGTSKKTVSRLTEEDLPKVRRIGSSIGYYGINVLCYIHKLPPVDTEAMTRQFRERLLNERPKIQSLPINTRKQRVF